VAKLQAYDPGAAMQLLDAAGYKPDASGVRFRIKHLALPYGEVWMRLSEYFRASMKKVGIEVTLESTDAGAWARRIGDWDYDTSTNFLSQYGDPTLGVERSYVSTNIKKITFTNTGGYSNPQVDALFATARNSPDPAVRQKAFTDVQKILCDEIPQIWLMELAWPTLHETKLHNIIRTAMGPNGDFEDAYFA
jgi:peptide/nickel transport system substrate-binding protein